MVLCFCIVFNTVWAQSYHFSQFFSTPLLTNPAHTGFTEGPFRIASNIRSQGTQGNPYFTGYLSADISLFRNNLTAGHKAGAGIYVMNDQSMSGAMKTNSVGLSTAYNVGLDEYGEQSFGVGLQATYHQRRIDYSQLTFENQYGSSGYDPSLPIGENFSTDNNQDFFDVNAGVMYNTILPDKAFFAGLAVYNILAHEENLLDGDEFTLPRRYTLQGGAQFNVGKNQRLYSSFTTMYQAKATETTIGAAFGYQFSDGDRNELIGGAWYRYKDALIPYIGYQYSGLQVGFSYDYTVSAVKAGAEIRNGFEITLQFKSPDKRELKTHIPWF